MKIQMFIYLGVFVALCDISAGANLGFAPLGSTKVWANDSGEALFSWTYTLSGQYDVFTARCGYIDGLDLKEFASKIGDTSDLTVSGSLPIRSKVEIIQNSNKKVLAFKIRNIQKSDPKQYRCSLISASVTSTKSTENKNSPVLTLEVLDPPKFTNCLRNIQTLDYNRQLQITCIVTGNPVPYLVCNLINYRGQQQEILPQRGPAQNNITGALFRSTIGREADKVICIATGDKTGSKNLSQFITVRHPPFSPRIFEQVPSAKTSIKVQWLQIPRNETGEQLNGYKLQYWVDIVGKLNQTTITITNIPNGPQAGLDYYTQNGYIYYELKNVDSTLVYVLTVWGFNRWEGTKIAEIKMQAGKEPETGESTGSNNTGAIVGGVIGGLVLIVLIVVLVVWCSRESETKKHYPTSYIEDAVNYPPDQSISLYTSAKKEPKAVSRSDSTSGYPDVVNNTSNYGQMKSNVTSSYEPSNKAFV